MFLAAAIVIRLLPDSGVGKYSNKRFWCSLLWLFGDYRALYPGLPFYRVAALYPRACMGLRFGVITTLGTISARLIPASRRGGASLFSLAMGLAMVVGPWIGLNMAHWNAFTAAFWLCSAVAALGNVLS